VHFETALYAHKIGIVNWIDYGDMVIKHTIKDDKLCISSFAWTVLYEITLAFTKVNHVLNKSYVYLSVYAA